MKRLLVLLLALCIVIGTVGCGGSDSADTPDEKEVTVMKVSVGVPDTHFEYDAVVKMAEYVKEATDGTLVMEIFPSAQIGNDKEVFEGLPLGVAHMLPCGTGVISNFVPEFGLLDMPYLFDDYEDVATVTEGEWGEALLAKLQDIGYIGLGFGNFGFRHTTNNVKPIETAADFGGLKIRTMSTPIHLKAFEALGANPTPMAFSELFSALQQGVVDGQENPLMNIYSNKLHEVQDYLTLDGHVFTLVAFVVSEDWFNSLDEVQQQALRDGADIASAHMRDTVISDDEYALKELEKYGTQITVMSDEAKAELKEITQPVNDTYGNEVNPEMYAELLDILSK